MTSPTDDRTVDPKEVFKNACASFRSALSDDDRRVFKEFPDAKSMLEAIGQQTKNHPSHSSLLTKCCKKIQGLSNKLEPYFEIINIFVQTHPEFAGLAWGSIRLVFLLGVNHTVFLERICNMFENMGMLLPAYEEYVESLRFRSRNQPKDMSDRLLRALAYIYSDLIQFCFNACKLLSKKRSKILRLKNSFEYSINWKPFDVRYDTLLTHWREHRELMDLEMRVSSHVEQIDSSARMEAMLRKIEVRWAGARNEETERREREQMERCLQQLRQWINPPDWFDLFESAQSRRTPYTNEWFLANITVKRWLGRLGTGLQGHGYNLLTVQGKPGYGKTTICTTLIEYLQKLHAPGYQSISTQNNVEAGVAFYYFDKQRPNTVESGAAFRTILTQLLHIFSGDKDSIDIASVIWNQQQGAQLHASYREVLSTLLLLIQRKGRAILIFDGVDECTDQDKFFQTMTEIQSISSSVSVVLFCRPTVKIPTDLARTSLSLDLEAKDNFQDICSYLYPKIANLIDEGGLPASSNVEETVRKISSRSSGMFLWVVLFLKYLQLPFISIQQRSEAIENLNRLKGLDSLYRTILESLKDQPSNQAVSGITRAFEFVAYSCRPLKVEELMYAIVIPMDRSVQQDDIIPNFAKTLSHMSGALMEIASDNTVRFIHLSVLEYITDPEQDHIGPSGADAGADAKGLAIHRSCACVCLSYLYYTVPAKPLGGSPQITPDRNLQRERYPLLEYASQFWSHHLLFCIRLAIAAPAKFLDDSFVIMDLVSSFISSKRAVTVWIEASWMNNHAPQIGSGPNENLLCKGFLLPVHSRNTKGGDLIAKALRHLQRLALDLESLNSSWTVVLKDTPNEIWEPSISAFTRSPFWMSVAGSTVSHFVSNERVDGTSACLKSQVSLDGVRMGVVKLRLPRRINGEWSIIYELWIINSRQRIHETVLALDGLAWSTQSQDSGENSVFCPVALSGDLNHLAVPGIIAKTTEWGHFASPTKPRVFHSEYQRLDMCLEDTPGWPRSQLDLAEFEKGYEMQISKSGEFLITLHQSRHLVDLSSRHSSFLGLITVYRDKQALSDSTPDYRYTAAIAFKPSVTESNGHKKDHILSSGVLLHPYLPMVGFINRGNIVMDNGHGCKEVLDDRNYDTALWDFSHQEQSIHLLNTGVHLGKDVQFSACGRLFCGKPIASFRNTPGSSGKFNAKVSRNHKRGPKTTWCSNSTALQASGSNAFDGYLLNATKPAIHDPGMLISTAESTGIRSISKLEQSNSGAVVLQKLREDGLMTSETLTQLPEWAAKDCQVTLLNAHGDGDGDDDDGGVRIVLNRAQKSFQQYRARDFAESEQTYPMILERKRETVSTYFGNGIYSLETGMRFQGETQQRLGWVHDYTSKRRRLTNKPK